ncbi:hypothetical protein OROGR_001592 [Orobanche gracilis]
MKWEILPSHRTNSFSFQRGVRAISKSAPLFPAKKLDSAVRITQLGPSPSRKFTSYVLPTPDETRSPGSGKLFNEAPQTKQTDLNLRHCSPLDQNMYEKLGISVKLSKPILLDTPSVLKESNNTAKPSSLPPPLSKTLSFKQLDPNLASYAKNVKRQAFSGPLTGKPWPNNPHVTANVSSAFLLPYSGSLLRTPLPRPTSTPKLSSCTFVSSPKISELHELPRPPSRTAARRPSNHGAHSGPLISKTHELSTSSILTASVAAASALPVPPLTLSRSYSIPAGGPMDVALRFPLEASQNSELAAEHISSLPLTSVSLPNVQVQLASPKI